MEMLEPSGGSINEEALMAMPALARSAPPAIATVSPPANLPVLLSHRLSKLYRPLSPFQRPTATRPAQAARPSGAFTATGGSGGGGGGGGAGGGSGAALYPLNPGAVLSANASLFVKISFVLAKADFYVSLVKRSAALDIPELGSLQGQLQAAYGRKATAPAPRLPAADVKPGQAVAAPFDGEWYRAVIQSIRANDKVSLLSASTRLQAAPPLEVEVFYVDFGNTEIVGLGELCRLKDNFTGPILGLRSLPVPPCTARESVPLKVPPPRREPPAATVRLARVRDAIPGGAAGRGDPGRLQDLPAHKWHL